MKKKDRIGLSYLEQGKLMEHIFIHSQDSIMITDAEGIITETNPATQKMTGYSASTLTQQPIQSIIVDQSSDMISTIAQQKNWEGRVNVKLQNTHIVPIDVTIIPLLNEHSALYAYIYILKNHSLQSKHYPAIDDQLTGLYNQNQLQNTLDTFTQPGALFSIELDNFRLINNCHNQHFGEILLKSIADRLKTACQTKDMLFHAGNGKFLLLKTGVFNQEQLKNITETILHALNKAFHIENQSIYIATNIGILNIPCLNIAKDRMLIAVDIAVCEAKKKGKNVYEMYTPEMELRVKYLNKLEIEIHQALEHHEIKVYYQPQYCLKTNTITGVEALARWHKQGQIILPDVFIPTAESSLVIIPIGRFIMYQACEEIHRLNQTRSTPLRLAINVSSVQIKQSDFTLTVKQVLKETGFPAELLDLEITESVIMDDVEFYLVKLNELGALGVQITIDDFGTGYSSLSYLQQFPLKKLKVDKSFLLDTPKNQSNFHILKTIIELANKIGLSTVAEGVENKNQLSQIQHLAYDGMQGFYFARPMPYQALINLMLNKQRKL